MIITKDNTVAEVVSDNIKTAHIFKKYGIDFCCGGGVSVAKACEKKDVNYADLEKEILAIEKESSGDENYKAWELDVLIDHILNTHHQYVRENIPLILQYAEKVAKVHGDWHPELKEIFSLFTELSQELQGHMQKEELVLFPYIYRLVEASRTNEQLEAPHFGTVTGPISMMEHEHEMAGDILRRIDALTNSYAAPEGACNTFIALYDALGSFEADLHQHIHLENNILFPAAIKLEKA